MANVKERTNQQVSVEKHLTDVQPRVGETRKPAKWDEPCASRCPRMNSKWSLLVGRLGGDNAFSLVP